MNARSNDVARSRNIYTAPRYPNNLITFHSKRTLLWRFDIVSNSKTYLGRHVKCWIFLLYFDEIWILCTDFYRSPQFKIL